MIDVHYWPTPNGKKVTIFLEEAGLDYTIVPLDISRGAQFTPEFLRMNPNHRMPVMVDHAPLGGATEPLIIFESGAILFYLAEKAGKFWPQEPRAKYEVAEWVIWQMANQGPKLGECGHFLRLGETQGDQSYAKRRFSDEANRLFGVMNNRLYDRTYLAGEDYTIADMINYPWATRWAELGQDIEEFVYLKRWLDAVAARPAVQRGMNVGKDFMAIRQAIAPEEEQRLMKMMFNQRAQPILKDHSRLP